MKNSYLFLILLSLFLFVFPPFVYSEDKSSKTSAVLDKELVKTKVDTRAKMLQAFLESYDSELAGNAQIFVEQADMYKLDWRLVAAISGVESTFAHQLPHDSHNAWGWGIYGDNVIYFDSYDEAIKTISKALRENYMDKWGTQDVYQIGKLYAASPTWAERVVYFMNKIEDFRIKNQIKTLSISL